MFFIKNDICDEKYLDYNKMPSVYPELDSITQVTVGNLYSSPIILLYILVRYHFFSMSLTDYDKLVQLYHSSPSNLNLQKDLSSSAEKVKEFKTIIESNVEITNTTLWLRFLGAIHDTQGKDERFLNIIFNTLEQGKIKYRIIVNEYDHKNWIAWSLGMPVARELSPPGYDRVYRNLMKTLASGHERYSEIEELYERCYRKKTFLFDLAWTGEEMSEKVIIFHQSKIDWLRIEFIAKKLIEKEGFCSSKDIKQVISEINLENEFLKDSYYGVPLLFDNLPNDFEKKNSVPPCFVTFVNNPTADYNPHRHIATVSNYLTFIPEINAQASYDIDRSNRPYWREVEKQLQSMMSILKQRNDHLNEQIKSMQHSHEEIVGVLREKINFINEKHQRLYFLLQEAKKQAQKSVDLTEERSEIYDSPCKFYKDPHAFFSNKKEVDKNVTNQEHIQKP